MQTVVLGGFGISALWFLILAYRVVRALLPGGEGVAGPGAIRLWIGFAITLLGSCMLCATIAGDAGTGNALGHALTHGLGGILGKIGTPLAGVGATLLGLPWLFDFGWHDAAYWLNTALGIRLPGAEPRDEDDEPVSVTREPRGSRWHLPRFQGSDSAPSQAPLGGRQGGTSGMIGMPGASGSAPQQGRFRRPTPWRPTPKQTPAQPLSSSRPTSWTPNVNSTRINGMGDQVGAPPPLAPSSSYDRHPGAIGTPTRATSWSPTPPRGARAPQATAMPHQGGHQPAAPVRNAPPPPSRTANPAALTMQRSWAISKPVPAPEVAANPASASDAANGTSATSDAASPDFRDALRSIEENAAQWTAVAGVAAALTAVHDLHGEAKPEAVEENLQAPAVTPATGVAGTYATPSFASAAPASVTQSTATPFSAAHVPAIAAQPVAPHATPAVTTPAPAAMPSWIAPITEAAAAQAMVAHGTPASSPAESHITPAAAAVAAPAASAPVSEAPHVSPGNTPPASTTSLAEDAYPADSFDEAALDDELPPWEAELASADEVEDTHHQAPVASSAPASAAAAPQSPFGATPAGAQQTPFGTATAAASHGAAPAVIESTLLAGAAAYATGAAWRAHTAPPAAPAASAPMSTPAPISPTAVEGFGQPSGNLHDPDASPYTAPYAQHPDSAESTALHSGDSDEAEEDLTPPHAPIAPAMPDFSAHTAPAAPASESAAPARPANPNAFAFEALPVTSVELPPLALLEPTSDSVEPISDAQLAQTSQVIEQRLQEFKVPVTVVGASAGPVITRFEIEPALGVRGSQIVGLMKDLSRGLGLTSIRVVETIPGKTCMGLELPNAKRQMIRLSEIIESRQYQHSVSQLTIAMGKDIIGNPVVTDLAKAPHMLVAGTTGSGKSVAINAMILSLLYKATPEDVRLIMIDPKMLELSVYEGIPHLLAPVVTDMKLAANALNWCVGEMEKRYRLMSAVGVRNLAGFNQKIRDAEAQEKKIGNPFSLTPDAPEPLSPLPMIVVVIDELADLMMVAGKKIEELIARLAQKARAAGIHLILATQRPSVDVITGLIKANIPTRVAFQVSSKIDSRTILDQMGAESLLGQGDMLFLPPGTGYPQRVHGAFVADEEVHRVVDYLKQFGEPEYVEGILDGPAGEGAAQDLFGDQPDAEADPLYDEAVAFVLRTRRASISAVQRQLRIGYNRAARLVEQMEAAGLVSPMGVNGSREILAPAQE